MNKKNYPWCLPVRAVFFCLVVVATDSGTNAVADGSDRTPNVLLIITDDQGWGDITSHGNSHIRTPNLDQLASEGARFERFYVSPVCAPTRAALLTGRWHPRTGVSGVTRGEETMRASERTIAEVLRDAGYRTGAFGKWHNGAHFPHDPNGQGFDKFVGFSAGHWDFYFDPPLTENQSPIRGEGFIIDDLTSRATAFINEDQQSSKPWFCYISYNTPHTPWQVPESYWNDVQDRGLKPTTACAYAMVENIDDNVGRLLSTVERLGQSDETIVVFLTDNGANTDRFNGEMRGRKGSLHEGGSRVPLFIRYPGAVPAGTVVSDIAAHIDLLPTLIDWAGITETDGPPLDGVSLTEALTDGKKLSDRLLFNHWNGRGSVRSERWRLVNEDRKTPRWQLFDMLADPSQTTDVADRHPEVTRRLAKAYREWWEDVSSAGFDAIPTEVGHKEAAKVRLPGHEAILLAGADGSPAGGATELRRATEPPISYHGANGWANDWIDNWTSSEASAYWPVRVVSPGRYAVELQWAADELGVGKDLGGGTGATELTLQAVDQELSWSLREPFTPVALETRDRIERKEVAPQTWAKTNVGTIELPAGEFRLYLRRTSDGPPIQVKSVELSRDTL